MSRSTKLSSLRLESLEERRMMAGDVDAYSISKILYITGDNADNGILITRDGDLVNVVGLTQGGTATTINKDSSSQTFYKIKDVVVTMGKGNDAIAITDLALTGNLYVSVGQGNDFIGLGNFDNNGGIDSAVNAHLGALSVGKTLIIDANDGDDDVLIKALSVDKAFTIALGAGNDEFYGEGITVAKNLVVDGGTGDDVITLAPDNSSDPGVTVTKTLTLNSGAGNDLVTFDKVSAKKLNASLSSHDDTLNVGNSNAEKSSSFSGDTGVNTYNDLGGNTLTKLKLKNFQNV